MAAPHWWAQYWSNPIEPLDASHTTVVFGVEFQIGSSLKDMSSNVRLSVDIRMMITRHIPRGCLDGCLRRPSSCYTEDVKFVLTS
ncbi:jg4176 [Pararge aegeria aegeria]|uniref:Jg4176 protein n=1 Tax=Pararge aegeria aegeria TaxID=348720 RepID=A0A8S4SC08_9NEOP|nr:jg4176 [Pararge aegeria aegeria]